MGLLQILRERVFFRHLPLLEQDAKRLLALRAQIWREDLSVQHIRRAAARPSRLAATPAKNQHRLISE